MTVILCHGRNIYPSTAGVYTPYLSFQGRGNMLPREDDGDYMVMVNNRLELIDHIKWDSLLSENKFMMCSRRVY